MKKLGMIMMALVGLAFSSSNVLTQDRPAATTTYQVIADTTSPNHHYAMAWGLPGQHSSIDFARLTRERNREWKEQTYAASLGLKQYDDAAYIFLVDLRTRRVKTRLNGIVHLRRQFEPWISAYWAPNSAMVLIDNSGRLYPMNIYACMLPTTGLVRQYSMLDQLKADLSHQLERAEGAKYRVQSAYLADNFSDFELSSNGQLTLTAQAGPPKQDPIYKGLLSYRLLVVRGHLMAVFRSLTSLQRIQSEPPSQ